MGLSHSLCKGTPAIVHHQDILLMVAREEMIATDAAGVTDLAHVLATTTVIVIEIEGSDVIGADLIHQSEAVRDHLGGARFWHFIEYCIMIRLYV